MTETNDVRGISRRDLMARTALIGAGLGAGPLVLAGCANKPEDISNRSDNDMQTRRLGALDVSELGRVHEHQRQLRASRGQEPGHPNRSRGPR